MTLYAGPETSLQNTDNNVRGLGLAKKEQFAQAKDRWESRPGKHRKSWQEKKLEASSR